MPIQLVTGSCADVSVAKQQEHNIQVVNLSVTWPDGTQSPPGDNHAFYSKLSTSKELPQTAAPSPGAFQEVFDAALAKGDEVICVVISGDISATYNSAVIAREQSIAPDKIYIVDSRSVAMGEQILLADAVRMRDAGHSAEDIVAVLESRRYDIRFYALVPDLKYLKMGGRISAGAATIGSLLNIKPIMGMEEGKVHAFGKGRGEKQAFQKFIDLVKTDGIDTTKPIMLGYSSDESMMKKLEVCLLEAGLPVESAEHCEIGSTIGTHAGPGACGISFVRCKNKT